MNIKKLISSFLLVFCFSGCANQKTTQIESLEPGNLSGVNLFCEEQDLFVTYSFFDQNRYETTNYFLEKGYKFENIVHHKINLKYVSLGLGNIIYENSLLQPLVKIGSHNVISSLSGVAHDTEIGDFNFIGPSTYICGRVKIKNQIFIGVGAKILPDLKIDNQAIIAAGSLVMKDIPKKGKVKGIPAKSF